MAGCRGKKKTRDVRAKQDNRSEMRERGGGRTRGKREKEDTKETGREREEVCRREADGLYVQQFQGSLVLEANTWCCTPAV